MAAFDQIVNSATKRQTRCSETNIPAKVHDGDGTDLPLICGQRWHVCLSESREIARRFPTKANNRPRSREADSYPKGASHTLAYIPSDKPVQRNVGTRPRLQGLPPMYVLEGICPASSGQGLTGQMQNFVRLVDQDSRRCNMKYRIAIWAAVGFLVASG